MESPHKKPVTISDITSSIPSIQSDETARLNRIEAEFAKGFEFIENLPKSVSFFGSTKATPSNPNYLKAKSLATRLVRELDYAVVTGGGPGIMEAANFGAHEAGGVSAGLTIELPTQQKPNQYINRQCDFHYFFARKVALSFAARLYIFFPGGYGTLDEFFEIVTLIQSNKIQKLPVICVDSQFWQPLYTWMNDYLLIQNNAIADSDLGLFSIVDNEDMALEIAKEAQKRR